MFPGVQARPALVAGLAVLALTACTTATESQGDDSPRQAASPGGDERPGGEDRPDGPPVRHAAVTGIFSSTIFFDHSAGPVLCTDSPFESTATVTGMSATSNS